MRFLITVAGLLVVAGTPVRLYAAQASVRPVALQDADPLSPLDRTVSLALDRVPLKAALDAVARQTGVRIAYSRRVVPLNRRVSLQLGAVSVGAVLDALVQGPGVAATLDRTGQILLVTDPDGTSRSARQTGSVTGTVRDAGSGAPLASVTVTVVGTRFSGGTQADGRHAISGGPPGAYPVRAPLLGHAPGDTSGVGPGGPGTVRGLGAPR